MCNSGEQYMFACGTVHDIFVTIVGSISSGQSKNEKRLLEETLIICKLGSLLNQISLLKCYNLFNGRK